MPSYFKPNKNFPKAFGHDPEYQNGLAGVAKAAAGAAKSFAPVETGAYRDSIQVVEDDGKVYVSAFDFKALWIENGSIHNTPSAPLRRGVRAVGLKLR